MPVDSAGREPGAPGYDRADAESHDKDGRDQDHGRDAAGGKDGHKPAAGGSWVKQHRDVLIITLTTVGVLIAWLTFKKKSGAAATATDPTTGLPTTGTGLGVPGQPDPNANGAVDGFAANLAHMNDLLTGLQANLGGSGTVTTPSSTPAPFDYTNMNQSWTNEPTTAPARFLYGKAAQGLRYIRNRTTGVIYQVNPNGRTYALGQSQYAELGKPKYVEYGRAPTPAKKAPAKPVKK